MTDIQLSILKGLCIGPYAMADAQLSAYRIIFTIGWLHSPEIFRGNMCIVPDALSGADGVPVRRRTAYLPRLPIFQVSPPAPDVIM